MFAAQINQYGEVAEIKIQETKVPELKEGQVLVKVKAASVNPFDVTLRSGKIQQMMPLPFPFTQGGDLAGVVTAVGTGVKDRAIGDEVYGTASVANGGSGAMAQFAAANVGNLAGRPNNVSWEEAAALPLAGVSAIQVLEEHMNIQPGQKILIHGGAGGIGSLAIQVAKMHGAYVATTVRQDWFEFARGLGADEVIDYKTEEFENRIKDYDAVLDTVGGEVTNKSLTVLRRGGILVTMIGTPDEAKAKERGITTVRQMTKVNTERLARLAGYIETGKIKPQIGKIFEWPQVAPAYDYYEQQSPKGKVVVSLANV